MRGLAALFVVVNHVFLRAFPGYPVDTAPFWAAWFIYGRFAVVVFIVLSGFSLAMTPMELANARLDLARALTEERPEVAVARREEHRAARPRDADPRRHHVGVHDHVPVVAAARPRHEHVDDGERGELAQEREWDHDGSIGAEHRVELADDQSWTHLERLGGDLELDDPEHGAGISVGRWFRNVNWVAVPGYALFFRGNLAPAFARAGRTGVTAAARESGSVQRGRPCSAAR